MTIPVAALLPAIALGFIAGMLFIMGMNDRIIARAKKELQGVCTPLVQAPTGTINRNWTTNYTPEDYESLLPGAVIVPVFQENLGLAKMVIDQWEGYIREGRRKEWRLKYGGPPTPDGDLLRLKVEQLLEQLQMASKYGPELEGAREMFDDLTPQMGKLLEQLKASEAPQ